MSAVVEIGRIRPDEMDAIMAIERACFPTPWDAEAFAAEVANSACARYLALRENGTAVAYAGMWFVMDEGHITNVAVRPDRRRMGYARMLLTALIQLAADSGMRYMTLECRRSNVGAQKLYHELGFVDVGYRKRYYTDTNEDALVMALTQMPEAHDEDDPALVRE